MSLWEEKDKALLEIVTRMTEKDLSRRFQSCVEVLQALEYKAPETRKVTQCVGDTP